MSWTRENLNDENSRATERANSSNDRLYKYSSDWVCDNCGERNDYDNDYCSNCGKEADE